MEERTISEDAKAKGTELHALAEMLIKNNRKLRGNDTLSAYVNDAIGYGMEPEFFLFYSYNAYGTADALKFDDRKNLLRIHDLKTGVHPQYKINKNTGEYVLEQLRVYAAYFCLDNDVKPIDINMELRIYQNDEVFIDIPKVDDIIVIMNKIITFDKIIDRTRLKEK